MPFIDRVDAGRRLAARLRHLRSDLVVVLGLPRGGVPVVYEVAADLAAPLDVILVRKLGVPFQPELAIGAIGEGGVRVLNDEVIRAAGVTTDELATVEQRERLELELRALRFRNGALRTSLRGKTAVLVDDGMATGSTALAACRVARHLGAERVVLAVPVAPEVTVRIAEGTADEVVCLESPSPFFGVGEWYHDFSQVPDEEVVDLLQGGIGRRAAEAARIRGREPCVGLPSRTRPRRRARHGRPPCPEGRGWRRGVRTRQRQQPPQREIGRWRGS